MLAIIPARGGSKGLIGKNIKSLLGKPLIAYTIEAALESKSVSRVVVSTDDLKIAEVAERYGAEVPFLRPDHLASDNSAAIDTYLYTIKRLERESHYSIHELMVLLPTCPLRDSSDIDSAIFLYRDRLADSVISYTEEHHPIYWHKKLKEDLRFENVWQEEFLLNRQNLERTYYPNGAIYIFKSELLHSGRYYSDNSFAHIMPRNRSVDIDTLEDFELAEFYLRKK